MGTGPGPVMCSAVALALSLVGCGGDEEDKTIIVGSSAAMTGIYHGFGQGTVFGIQAAVEDVNALGGVEVPSEGGKLKIDFRFVDNEGDPLLARDVAESLIVDDGVIALLSSGPPDVNTPISPMAEEHGIPQIVCSGPMEPWTTLRMAADPPWEYSWGSGFAIAAPPPEGDFTEGQSGYTIRDVWLGNLEQFGDQTNKRVGLFASDDPDGRGWYTPFANLLSDAGYDVLGADENLGLFSLDATDPTDHAELIQAWQDYGVEIIWGNSPAPHFLALWKQASSMDLKPKVVSAGRAALFWSDVSTWGETLPLGVGSELFWSEKFPASECPGIGDTTPASLAARWAEKNDTPVNMMAGSGYAGVQVLVDAIRRADSLDPEKINEALGQTDVQTMEHRVKYHPEEHFSRSPLFFGQWVKSGDEWDWELAITFSQHDWMPADADKAVFPIP